LIQSRPTEGSTEESRVQTHEFQGQPER
jgi:hypothetical protein